MNITKVAYSRKFNLGNYETLDLSIEAQLSEKDNPLEVWSILADNAEMWFIAQNNKQTAKLQPQQTQQPQASQQPAASPLPSPSPTPIKWEKMPATEKGSWEKTVNLNNPEIESIIEKIKQADNKVVDIGNYRYWKIYFDNQLTGVGRRIKA